MTTARLPERALPDPPPVVARLRALVAEHTDAAHEAANRMRNAVDETYRIGQAERSIAMFEAALTARDVLDLAENETPARH